MLVSISVDLNIQDVYIAKLVLELLRTAKAHKLSLCHDGQPGTEGVAFLDSSKTRYQNNVKLKSSLLEDLLL